MKKILIAAVAIILVFGGIASSAETLDDSSDETSLASESKIAHLTWNAANIDALRALDKAAIAEFTNIDVMAGALPIETMGGFTWADLAGDGKYELLVTTYTKCCGYLDIYWQDAPGKLRMQRYDGAADDPNEIIKDLNGDGKQELILSARLDSEHRPPRLPAPVAGWPQVYRLRNGRYVEASRDFPSYYDSEVLPELDKDISKFRQQAAEVQGKPKPTPGPYAEQQKVDEEWSRPGRYLAVTAMERDKILRVLGRDPNAGLAEAREWMKSPDPELVEDAVVVLTDMGGHEQELGAAKSALFRLEPWKAKIID